MFFDSKLTVQLNGGTTQDRLSIRASGGLTLGSNGTLVYNGVSIGSYTGGSGSTALSIIFNSKATQASVNAVIENVTFAYDATSGSPVFTVRRATFQFTNGNNSASSLVTQNLNILR